MQVLNHTPFPAIAWISTDPKQKQYTTTLVRVKYRLDTMDEEGLWSLKLDPEQGELFSSDIFYDDENKVVQFESDFVPFKREADLIINMDLNRKEYGACGVKVLRYHGEGEAESLLNYGIVEKFGFVHRADKSRMQWIGTPDAQWVERKAPALPEDFDERHYNAAHEKMQLPFTYFHPGDLIVLSKLLKGQHKQSIFIPGLYLTASSTIGQQKPPVLLEADTVIIDMESLELEENALYISYRSRVEEENVQSITIEMMLDEALIEKGDSDGK